jgi:hypothetical protein
VGTNTLVLVGLAAVAVVLYMRNQNMNDSPMGTAANPAMGATPQGGTPGFGFNLGFFRNE